jgi:hypothetical protein
LPARAVLVLRASAFEVSLLAALIAGEILVTLNAATVVQPYLPARSWTMTGARRRERPWCG